MNYYPKFFKTVLPLIITLFLSGCGIAPTPVTPDPNQVATIVEATMMSIPTATKVIETESIIPSVTALIETEIPTETPAPSHTPTQTETPTQTDIPTLAADDPRAQLGVPTWQATFSGSNWFTFEDKQSSIQLKDSTLVLKAFLANNYESWSMASPKISNFYLEIQGTSGDACQGKDRYGLIFRAPDPNKGYLFGISCDGFYRLRTWDGEKFTELAGWHQSEFIQTGPNQTNRIGVLTKGAKLSLYINGNLVDEIQDATYSEGVFGAYIAASNSPNFSVIISQAAYWLKLE